MKLNFEHNPSTGACFSKFFPFLTLVTLLHIFCSPFTFSTPNLAPFRHGVPLLPTCLPGLESPQVLHRIKSNAVLSLFRLELGLTKWPHCILAPATPTISSFTAREMPQVATRTTHCISGDGAQPKGGRKTITLFSNFHGVVPDTNYKHLECFIMLGTHSKLCWGQMSHICDISPLRVKQLLFLSYHNIVKRFYNFVFYY